MHTSLKRLCAFFLVNKWISNESWVRRVILKECRRYRKNYVMNTSGAEGISHESGSHPREDWRYCPRRWHLPSIHKLEATKVYNSKPRAHTRAHSISIPVYPFMFDRVVEDTQPGTECSHSLSTNSPII